MIQTYQVHGHTYRYYRANQTHWCLDVSRHDTADNNGAKWEVVCYDREPRAVRAALVDAVLSDLPLLPELRYTAVITGKSSPRDCLPHAATLRGHGFTFVDHAGIRPAEWIKPDCDFGALNDARALAATLGLRYLRRAVAPRPTAAAAVMEGRP